MHTISRHTISIIFILPLAPIQVLLKKLNTVIFIHGCYFHRHKNCRYASQPKSNIAFWKKKFADNVKRDKLVKQTLKKQGWKIIEVWECEVKGKKHTPNPSRLHISQPTEGNAPNRMLEKLLKKLRTNP